MLYVGFTLNLFTFLTVISLFVMRMSRKDLQGTYKTFGYPLTPLIFLILSAWTIYSTLIDHTMESLFGMATILAGSVIYFIGKNK
jgi:APA family basic amino acid/polyamine antiporter